MDSGLSAGVADTLRYLSAATKRASVQRSQNQPTCAGSRHRPCSPLGRGDWLCSVHPGSQLGPCSWLYRDRSGLEDAGSHPSCAHRLSAGSRAETWDRTGPRVPGHPSEDTWEGQVTVPSHLSCPCWPSHGLPSRHLVRLLASYS